MKDWHLLSVLLIALRGSHRTKKLQVRLEVLSTATTNHFCMVNLALSSTIIGSEDFTLEDEHNRFYLDGDGITFYTEEEKGFEERFSLDSIVKLSINFEKDLPEFIVKGVHKNHLAIVTLKLI